MRRRLLFFSFFPLLLFLTALFPYHAVAAENTSAPVLSDVGATQSLSPEYRMPITVPLVWQPLIARLAADGISGPDIDSYFARLGEVPTQEPMGRKVRELYRRAFLRTPPDPNAPKTPRPRFYSGVVTEENARKCREYLAANTDAFASAEARYGVSKSIAVALLFVETRLGTMLGTESAFYTLASMASSTAPEHISLWLSKLPNYETHLDWIAELMTKRADWAYKELRALLAYTRAQNIDPCTMPGSIYGAIGFCQFMPSNLLPYGADGNGDGVVDLFTVSDAVASLSNYLSKHGWKPGISRTRQHALLKTYNRADIYANTILALSDLIVGTRPAPATPRKTSPKASNPRPTAY